MSRKATHRRGATSNGGPAPESGIPKEGDVKVPIEVNDDHKQSKATETGAKQDASSAKASSVVDDSASDDAEEKKRVEAAIHAGEQMADEELRSKAVKRLKDAQNARDELQKKLDGVQDEIDAAKKEAADTSERLVRLQADWDNYRRRTAQERLEERERAAEKLVVSLLPVLDDMERALDHADRSATNDNVDNQFNQFIAGVQAVHDKMLSILGKEGVEVIDPKGEPFDPLVHQAVGRIEDKDSFNETVSSVYQRGYRMGGKVIREAMVQVTFGGPQRPTPEQATVDTEDSPDVSDADKTEAKR